LPALAKPIVFSNVNLKYSQKSKAFYSEGTLGVSNIGKADINGAFEGFMEIRKNEDGSPVFHVFFKASPDAWYYFGYEDNRLLIQSSSKEFNALISKKTNASKAKVGDLVFIPGSDEETLSFITRFRPRCASSSRGCVAPYRPTTASTFCSSAVNPFNFRGCSSAHTTRPPRSPRREPSAGDSWSGVPLGHTKTPIST